MMTTFCGVAAAPTGAAASSDEAMISDATSASLMRFGNRSLLDGMDPGTVPEGF
jgi:hypothetical protein